MPRSLVPVIALTCALAAGCTARAGETARPAPRSNDLMELHGVFRGQRFWARLKPGDPEFQGHRFLRLLYTQPTPAQLGGTILIDHPIVLLDVRTLAVRAWNESHSGVGLSGILYEDLKEPPGYLVAQGYLDGEGDDAVELTRERRHAGGPAWDVRLAPLLLAFAYDAAAPPIAIDGRDFYSAVDSGVIPIRWDATTLTIGEDGYTLEADGQGRLRSVTPAGADRPLLTITAWLAGGGETPAGTGAVEEAP